MKIIPFLFLLFVFIGCSERVNSGKFGNYQITTDQSKINLFAFMINPKTHLKENKSYSFYNNNKIIEVQGSIAGKLLHGRFNEQFLDNSTKVNGKFYKGLKDGKWIYYHPNSKLKQTIHYKKGDTIGPVHFYNTKGELTETIYNQKQTLILKKQIEKAERKKEEKEKKAQLKEKETQKSNQRNNNYPKPPEPESKKRKINWPKFNWFHKDSTAKEKN